MNRLPTVYILTCCQSLDTLYGSLLTFKTLRVGFPNATVHVVDNCSIPAARSAIRKCAKDTGSFFHELPRRIRHAEFLEREILDAREGIVFLDPDLCFWESCESWEFDNALLAGRFIPEHASGATTVKKRLHTSFLWAPNPPKLRAEIEYTLHKYPQWTPFQHALLFEDGAPTFWDTGASLYGALDATYLTPFLVDELNSYDHLFCGSHLPLKKGADFFDALSEKHNEVKKDYRSLRGAWREQEKYFRDNKLQAVQR